MALLNNGTNSNAVNNAVNNSVPKSVTGSVTGLITALSNLVVAIKVLKWVAWNAHWSARGPNSYSDHLLMERIYSKLDNQTDSVVENILGYSGTFGVSFNQSTWAISVEQSVLASLSQLLRNREETISPACVLKATESVKYQCNVAIEQYKSLTADSEATASVVLGLEDLIPAISKKMDTFVYLLQQRGQ